MQMLTEKYVYPAKSLRDKLLTFTSRGISGAEIYTFVSVNYHSLPEGRIFCAADETGNVKSALYNNGDRNVICEAGKSPYEGLYLLRFSGKCPEKNEGVLPLTLADARGIYNVIDGKEKLSVSDEERYVYKARCMRDGFSFGFGVKENGKLLSFAFIIAKNEDTCLLGDVFTVPHRRNEGLAKICINACIRKALEEKKTPYTLCEEKNLDFYHRLQFA